MAGVEICEFANVDGKEKASNEEVVAALDVEASGGDCD